MTFNFCKALIFSLCVQFFLVFDADAGRNYSAFTLGTQTLNQGDFEFEEWITGKLKPTDSPSSIGWIWFAPVYGFTRNIEVAFPWEMAMTSTQTSLTDVAIDVRCLLFDRLEPPTLQPMLRLLYQFNFNHPGNKGRVMIPWLGANLVFSVGNPIGSHATVDMGYFGDAAIAVQQLRYHTLGLSYSHSLIEKSLNIGAEYYHEISLNQNFDSGKRFFAGPNMSFSRAQVWMTFGILRGLTSGSPDYQTRFMLGVNI